MVIQLILIFLLQFTNFAFADLKADFAKIESTYKTRLGVFAIHGEKTISYREDERFAYCSTFKWVLCAAILKKVEAKELSLEKKIKYSQKDLLSYSPITSKYVSEGQMTVADLCSATITLSDNTAANLLSPLVGGTIGLQKFVRNMDDTIMRFDRPEPDLNSNISGDPQDTTSSKAMASLLRNALSGAKLSKKSQEQLLSWMREASTGKDRIRAGVPKEWKVGNKTGTGNNGAANDVGVIFPPNSPRIYISIFTSGNESDLKSHEKAIAEATKLVVNALEIQ